MDDYLNLVSSIFAASPAPSPESFSQLVVLPASTHNALQASLRSVSGRTIDAQALTKRISKASGNRVEVPVAQRIAAVLAALLEYVASSPSVLELAHSGQRSREAWLQTYSLEVWTAAHTNWGVLFNRSSSLFALPTSSPTYFFAAFRFISSTFLSLSIRLDVLTNEVIKYPRLTDCTARLAGPVRASGTDRTPLEGQKTRRRAAMWLGNDCLRGYFKLNNLKLCETVLKSIKEAINRNREFATVGGDAATGEEPYPMSERVRYRYYLGRIRISQGRVREGFQQLQWALEHCPTNATVQIRRILLHLLPLALILGLRPNPQLIASFCTPESELGYLYLPLFRAYAKPDVAGFERLMAERQRKERLRKLGVYLLLQEKCVAPMWRGLIKRCLVITLPRAPPNPNAPPTLALPLLLKGAQYALGQQASGSKNGSEEDVSKLREVDVECIVASLIDQGYIKGYTFHSKRLLVFQKGPTLGFPRVRDVY